MRERTFEHTLNNQVCVVTVISEADGGWIMHWPNGIEVDYDKIPQGEMNTILEIVYELRVGDTG